MGRKFIEAYIMDCASRNNLYNNNRGNMDGRMSYNDRYSSPMMDNNRSMSMNDGRGSYGYAGLGKVGYFSSNAPQNRDYARYDYGYRNDEAYEYQGYADMFKDMKLTRDDLERWNKKIERETKCWKAEQLMPYIRKYNDIRFDRYTEEEFVMAVNMLHSDYRQALGDDPDIYVKLAKLFLEDKDSSVKGSERLALYYNWFVDCDTDYGML